MHPRRPAFLSFGSARALALGAALLFPRPALAQSTTPGGSPPDDTPSLRVGVTLFTDYTVQQEPKLIDNDGNEVTFNQFNIGRAYISVAGDISKRVAFRITPDIAREIGPGSSLNGSYTFRLKYAYAQFKLDDWIGSASWVRLGMQPTPWMSFAESVYRYRFQGSVFEEREGFLGSSDAGASFAYTLPGQYGDVHTGYFNGEAFTHTEANDQKGVQTRVTVRPMPMRPALRGLRLTGFYDRDAYVRHAERRRAVAAATFEHPRLNAAFDYFAATDRMSAVSSPIRSRGYSVWVTPRGTNGWEGLLRYDHLARDADRPGAKTRTIIGAAYWFPHQGTVSAALLFDVEAVAFHEFVASRAAERRIGLHALVSF
jgi:hypothetical protein